MSAKYVSFRCWQASQACMHQCLGQQPKPCITALCRYMGTTAKRTTNCSGFITNTNGVDFLSNLLRINLEEAQDISSKYPRLLTTDKVKMVAVADMLLSGGISLEEIKKYPQVFSRSCITLSARLKVLHNARVDPVTVRMLTCSVKVFDRIMNEFDKTKTALGDHESPSEALADWLYCTREEIEKLLESHRVIRNSKISTIAPKIELLLAHNVPPEEIRAKIWVLGFPLDMLRYRVKILETTGITPENCRSYINLLKCPECLFGRSLESHRVELEISRQFGGKMNYLALRLKCDVGSVETLFEAHPKLSKIRLVKLKSNLDYLLSECMFSPADVIKHPKVLNFSLDTLKSRYNELLNINNLPCSVYFLQMDSRQFVKIVGRTV